MKKTWLITLTMTLATLNVASGRVQAQGPQAPSAGAPHPADVSARPNQKEKHYTDAEFVQKAAEAGKKEVNDATFAVLTASNADVKALANRLVKDHTAANLELDGIVRAKKHEIVEHRPSTKGESWRTETGASFDRAYVEHVIDAHDDAIELFEDQSTKGTDAELKAWATGKLPTLREHLKMARDLKAKLGS